MFSNRLPETIRANAVPKLIALSAALLVGVVAVVLARSGRGPQIELSLQHLNLGIGLPNDRMRGTFFIRNIGTDQLQFTLHPSCGCAHLAPREGSVTPGGQQEIEVVVRLSGIGGAEKSAKIDVRSNDINTPTVSCGLQAIASTPFQCVPAYINFKTRPSSDDRDTSVSVAMLNAEGEPLTDLDCITATCDSDAFTVQSQLDDSGQVVVHVGFLGLGSEQRIYSKIEVTDSKSGYRLAIPVEAEHVPEFRVVPSTVLFWLDPKTGQCREKTILVWASEPETTIGQLISYESPDDIVVIESEQTGKQDRRKQLMLRLKRPLEAGTHGNVKLNFAKGIEVFVEYRISG